MSDASEGERRGHCAICGEMTATDIMGSGVRAGRLLCGECCDREVAYEVECLDCGWHHSQIGPAHQWYHLRQNVQQQGNNHEKEKYHFEDEKHITAWRFLNISESDAR